MFRESIQAVVDGTDGGMAGVLMDFEGISVDSYAKDNAPFDIQVVGAELSVILKSIQRAAESLEAGGPNEVSIQADKMTTLVRILNGEYFLAVAVGPNGNLGKGRYLMRTAAPKLLEALS